MTSSLVGSEMCIRDRGFQPRNIQNLNPTPPPPPQHRNQRPPRPPHRPVSYTHLTLPTICSV
eukprot:2692027-Prorocentrum_lima.AAC.1